MAVKPLKVLAFPFKLLLSIVGIAKKYNLLFKILEAEQNLKNKTGPEKLAYVVNSFKKSFLYPAAKKKAEQLKKKGLDLGMGINAWVDKQLPEVEASVNQLVKVFNLIGLLTPHKEAANENPLYAAEASAAADRG